MAITASPVYMRLLQRIMQQMFPPLHLPGGRQIAFGERPLVMGIINVTPDSFSDGGLFEDAETAIDLGLRLAEEGADIVDIGGESTRPGHVALGAEEELRRVMPVIEGLNHLAAPISIDTYKASIAEDAIKAGATIINDVWGAQRDPAIAEVAARTGAPMVLMHNRDKADASLAIIDEVRRFLERSVALATASGVPHSQIVLDPGIGFGKTPEQNLILIKHLQKLRDLGCPVLLGVSRKSTIGLITGQKMPRDRLAGSIAANLQGVIAGADIIRVHDVRAHLDALKVWAAIGALA